MKAFRTGVEAAFVACLVIVIGGLCLHVMYADRIALHIRVGTFPLGGLKQKDVSGALAAYAQEIQGKTVHIRLRGVERARTLQELGATIDIQQTERAVRNAQKQKFAVFSWTQIRPVFAFQNDIAVSVLRKDFADTMNAPKDASLLVEGASKVMVIPGVAGEDVDVVSLRRDILHVVTQLGAPVITISVVPADPRVQAGAVEVVRPFAEQLLREGFRIVRNDQTFDINGKSIAQLIRFSSAPSSHIAFDPAILEEYLKNHVALAVHEDAVNARFKMEDNIVKQFALPKNGNDLDLNATIDQISQALARQETSSVAVMREVAPVIASEQGSEQFGISSLLAAGETDFRGSPKNRIKNIIVGAERFNGILIAPNEEFSFLKYLGPVDKEAGFFPELVIKGNKTIPEYGGGLCQVSTTTFRAAMFSGLPVTQRRNHSYAVAYYGTPGFDATIYPPYTDFRFLNNTPGYLLIQTRIDGTKLTFEFWGTADGRESTIDGPHPYGRMPDGSVKSILKRTVTRDGNVIIDDTFRSNYKSPSLFPHESATPPKAAAAPTAPGEKAANSNG